MCQALGETFSEKYPGVSVEKSGTGSGDAPNSVRSGIALVGDMSRDLKESENPDEFEIKKIALDGIAIAVHKDNPIQDLTTEQIRKIFTGEIKIGVNLAVKIRQLLHWEERRLQELGMDLNLFSA